jgi:hypothetical protein
MKLPVLMACAVAILSATTMKLHAFPFASLKLQSTVDTATVAVGDAVAITVSVEHLISDFEALETATNGMVTIVVPDGSSSLTSSDCTVESANTMVCNLPEMAVGESVELAATAVINREGYQQLTTTLTADDESTALTVTSVNPDDSPVDLALDVRNSGGESYLGGYVYVSTVVKNVHEINTTHFPIVEIVVPEDLQYVPNDRCVENAGTALCEVVALPPGAEATAIFAFITSSIIDELSIVASAASTQPDTAPQNNTATFVTSVVQQPVLCGASNPSCINGGDEESSTDPENSGTGQLETGQASSETQSTGGGVFPLLFVFAALLRRFRGSKRM